MIVKRSDLSSAQLEEQAYRCGLKGLRGKVAFGWKAGHMRIERSVTSISWLPSEAVEGIIALPFDLGITRYDPPPPDRIGDLATMARDGSFRFANQLRAYVDVEDGRIVNYGHLGDGVFSGSEVRFGPAKLRYPPVMLPVVRLEPEVEDEGVRFVQTVGGRTSLPSPRKTRGGRVRLDAPLVWTTLALTIKRDGTHDSELVGASTIPRHWLYDDAGRLLEKSAVMEFGGWYESAEIDTPWGGPDHPLLTAPSESDLERRLSRLVMTTGTTIRREVLSAGELLVAQGDAGDELFLVLDGMLAVVVDNNEVAEVGPGAIVGERAVLGTGRRTASLRALTKTRLAVIPSAALDRADLEVLGAMHRREEIPSPD